MDFWDKKTDTVKGSFLFALLDKLLLGSLIALAVLQYQSCQEQNSVRMQHEYASEQQIHQQVVIAARFRTDNLVRQRDELIEAVAKYLAILNNYEASRSISKQDKNDLRKQRITIEGKLSQMSNFEPSMSACGEWLQEAVNYAHSDILGSANVGAKIPDWQPKIQRRYQALLNFLPTVVMKAINRDYALLRHERAPVPGTATAPEDLQNTETFPNENKRNDNPCAVN